MSKIDASKPEDADAFKTEPAEAHFDVKGGIYREGRGYDLQDSSGDSIVRPRQNTNSQLGHIKSFKLRLL